MDPKKCYKEIHQRSGRAGVVSQSLTCGMVPRGPFVNSLFPRRMRIMEGVLIKKKKKRKEDEGPVRKQKWTSRGDRNKTF